MCIRDSLSTMLKAALDRNGRTKIPLSEELGYVDAYLYIIRERLGEGGMDMPMEDMPMEDMPAEGMDMMLSLIHICIPAIRFKYSVLFCSSISSACRGCRTFFC